MILSLPDPILILDVDSCRHWVVEEGVTAGVPVLDPVVVAALENLTSFVFRRRRIYSLRLEKRSKSLADPGARAGAVHTFKHLKYHGYSFDPGAVAHWAKAHGWTADDADELSNYAAGVLAGTRYHTRPDPFGMGAIDRWRAAAQGME
jgi:hypothetical protein